MEVTLEYRIHSIIHQRNRRENRPRLDTPVKANRHKEDYKAKPMIRRGMEVMVIVKGDKDNQLEGNDQWKLINLHQRQCIHLDIAAVPELGKFVKTWLKMMEIALAPMNIIMIEMDKVETLEIVLRGII